MTGGPRLSLRLAAAARSYERCGKIVDIGTDHALLPVRLLLDDRADFALLADIAKGPLEKAEQTVRAYGMEQKTRLCLSDGFEHVGAQDFDTAFICGMGGVNIITVLAAAGHIFDRKKRFCLQPQTDSVNLRAYLLDSGFELTREYAVADRGHVYTVMAAQCAKPRLQNAADYIKYNPAWSGRREVILGKLDPFLPDDSQFLRQLHKLYSPKAANMPDEYAKTVEMITEALDENGK